MLTAVFERELIQTGFQEIMVVYRSFYTNYQKKRTMFHLAKTYEGDRVRSFSGVVTRRDSAVNSRDQEP